MEFKTNRNFRYLLIALLSLTILFIVICKNDLNIMYIRLFRKSEIVRHYNKNRQLDGEYISYIRGKTYLKTYFKNGLREGWCVWYDENSGKKKHEIYYRKGVPDGLENVYYTSGNLNYSTQWKNGKNYNSEHHYLDNGALNTYWAFDLSKDKDNGYCYVAYDNAGKFHQILGRVFSSYIYSICGDSTIVLIENGRYTCLSSLYINVATPPLLKSSIEVSINKIQFTEPDVKNNILIIPNVFDKPGKYEIVISGYLHTTYGTIIKSDILSTSFFKE